MNEKVRISYVERHTAMIIQRQLIYVVGSPKKLEVRIWEVIGKLGLWIVVSTCFGAFQILLKISCCDDRIAVYPVLISTRLRYPPEWLGNQQREPCTTLIFQTKWITGVRWLGDYRVRQCGTVCQNTQVNFASSFQPRFKKFVYICMTHDCGMLFVFTLEYQRNSFN